MTYGNNEETHCLRTNSRTRCQSAYQVRGCMVQARVSRHRVKEWLTQKQNQWTTWHFEYLEYNILLFDLKIRGENYEILKSSRQEKTRCECQDQSHGNLTTAGEWLAVITEVYKQIAHLMEADITTLKSRKGQRHVYRRKVDSYRGEGPQTPNRTSLPYMLLKEETFLHSGRIPSPFPWGHSRRPGLSFFRLADSLDSASLPCIPSWAICCVHAWLLSTSIAFCNHSHHE